MRPVTASKEERARARIKKEQILNIIVITDEMDLKIEYCVSYFKGKRNKRDTASGL